MKRATPIRTCVGCRNRDFQTQLLRFSFREQEMLVTGPGNGRGGYVHPRRTCLHAFANARSGFVRSLRAIVPQEIRVRYLAHIESSATLLS
jgi:predicted RNA-binding protein YlxR (DUF448 family)